MLWVLIRIASLRHEYAQNMFSAEIRKIFILCGRKKLIYLAIIPVFCSSSIYFLTCSVMLDLRIVFT